MPSRYSGCKSRKVLSRTHGKVLPACFVELRPEPLRLLVDACPIAERMDPPVTFGNSDPSKLIRQRKEEELHTLNLGPMPQDPGTLLKSQGKNEDDSRVMGLRLSPTFLMHAVI